MKCESWRILIRHKRYRYPRDEFYRLYARIRAYKAAKWKYCLSGKNWRQVKPKKG